jgi:macrolide transport system ATP-binding/permease protein
MNGLLEDLRFGLRALLKYRAFTAVAVFSLALGIGANTTVFTLVHAILMRRLPVIEQDRLVEVYTRDSQTPGNWGSSFPNYLDYRDHTRTLSSLMLYTGVSLNLTDRAEPRMIMGQIASSNYFDTLGVKPIIGRTFLPEEDTTPGANPVAIVSYRFWQHEYNGDPNVTTRTLGINGRTFNIIGVAPRGFDGIDTLTATEIWVPFMMYRQVYNAPDLVEKRRSLLFSMVGRLKPGVTIAQANGDLNSIAQDLARRYPDDNRDRRISLSTVTEAAIPSSNRNQITDASLLLLIVSGVVAVIACGNVASLLMSRAAARGKEITLRLALGASRARLVRQLLTESLLLSLIGGAAGLLIAIWGRNLLWSMRPPTFRFAAIDLTLDRSVLAYTLMVSVFTGVIFGLAPALRATRNDLASDLKERTGKAASHSGPWSARSMLVMGQVAFSLVALVGAGLFVRSLRNAGQIEPGYDSEHLGFVLIDMASQGYKEDRGREFERQALDRVSQLPGVAAAAISKDWPLHASYNRVMQLEGQPPDAGRSVLVTFSAPGYFQTVATPLLRGRDFTDRDAKTAPLVAIVNESAARACWPGQDPIGQRVRFSPGAPLAEVIGIAANANYEALGEKPQPLAYLSLTQYFFPLVALYYRTPGDPALLLDTVRRTVQGLDHNLLLQAETVHTTIQQSVWEQRLTATLLSLFGALALVLACIGIYGVVSYSVAQRTREFGIRMALGATPREVERMLVVEGIRLVAIGVLVGTAIAIFASQAVKSMLYTGGSGDAITFILVPAILTLVALFACWFPARRATVIEPWVALRDE